MDFEKTAPATSEYDSVQLSSGGGFGQTLNFNAGQRHKLDEGEEGTSAKKQRTESKTEVLQNLLAHDQKSRGIGPTDASSHIELCTTSKAAGGVGGTTT